MGRLVEHGRERHAPAKAQLLLDRRAADYQQAV